MESFFSNLLYTPELIIPGSRPRNESGWVVDYADSLNNGLHGWWMLNEGSGEQVRDIGPFKNHGTLKNAVVSDLWVPGMKDGYALDADGVDSYVEIRDDASNPVWTADDIKTYGITFSCWVYRLALKNLDFCYVIGGAGSWTHHGYSVGGIFLLDGEYIQSTVEVYDGSDYRQAASGAADSLVDGWNHICGVVNPYSSLLELYVNGNLADTTAFNPSGVSFNATQVSIHRKHDLYSSPGWAIQDVRIFLRTFDACEVSQLAQGAIPVLPAVDYFAFSPLSGGLILVVQNALNGHAAQSPALTQANVLGVSEALHSHAAQSPALTQANVLGVSEALHSHTAESPQLSAGQMLIAQDALHSHTAESPALTQANVLGVAEALHSHAAESPQLSAGQMLIAQDALHSHAAESPALIHAGVLGVAEALHSHVAESPTLMFGQVLIVSDSWHDLISENVALTQASVLLVDAALHAHSVDSVAIIPGFTLAVADALHAHAAENPVLITGDSLLPDDALHLQTAGDPTLLTEMILRVNNSWHGHIADNVIFAGLDIGVGCLLFVPLQDAHYYSDIAETIFSVNTCN